jgi:hypothetical protein
MNEFLNNNRSLWNGWTRLHKHSRFYDVESFKAGRSNCRTCFRCGRVVPTNS